MEVKTIAKENGNVRLLVQFEAAVLTKQLDMDYESYMRVHQSSTLKRAELAATEEGSNMLHAAVEEILSDYYADIIRRSGYKVASRPQISVKQADESDGVQLEIQFALPPEVKLGNYKGIRVKMPEYELTEDEKTSVLAQAAGQNAASVTVDRAAKLGDTTVIDFAGFMDDVQFEGGTGSNYALTLGSGMFIPGFEDQLVGASAGDEVDVRVSFPENYGAQQLAGKPALFKVTVKSVAETKIEPLTDEQKQQVLQQASMQKQEQANQIVEDAVLSEILRTTEIDIPSAMLQSEVGICLQQFASQLQAQGQSFDYFMKMTGKTTDEIAKEMQPLAERRIQLRLILSAIAEKEALTASDEELEQQWSSMAAQYGITVDEMKLYSGEGADEQMRAEIVSQKAYALLRESTVLVRE